MTPGRHVVVVSAFILILLILTVAPAPAAPEWTASRVTDLARVSGVQISPDGSSVVYALSRPRAPEDAPGPAHASLWVVPFGGGTPRRMTSAGAEDKAPAWSPDGTRLAFLSARGGTDAKTRLWVMAVAGGEPAPVTSEQVEVAAFAWAPHGRSIAYVAADPKRKEQEKAEKEGRDWTVVDEDLRPRRLWIAPVEGSSAREPYPVASAGDLSAWEFDWSPHGHSLVATVSDTPRTDDSYVGKRVVILPLGDDEATELVGPAGKVDQVAWSRDGVTIALRAGTDPSDPFSGSVFLVPSSGGTPRNITGEREESVNHIAWLGDGRLAMVAVRGARTTLSVVRPQGPSSIADLMEGGEVVYTAASFSENGRRVALSGSTAHHPPEAYAGMVTGRSGLTRISSSNPGLDTLPLGRQERFAYEAGDGLRIESVLIHPSGRAARSPEGSPLVVIAHGGPESQYLDGWNTSPTAPGQALAERGWFVFYPNYRGSTGRGVAFSKADHQDLGGREMQDVVDGIAALAARYPVDQARVGITGGSYGGYFTSLAVTRHSDRFAAGVSLFGITNWMSFMGTTDIPQENAGVHWNLSCYEHPEVCWQASPIAHIDRARTPTLILHGEKDERVPPSQSKELYTALRWKGIPAQMVLFPREKHGFRERAHQIEAMDRLVGWFERHLR